MDVTLPVPKTFLGMAQSLYLAAECLVSTTSSYRILLPLTRLHVMAATNFIEPRSSKRCAVCARWWRFCIQNRTVYCDIKPNTQHFDMIVSQASIFAYQVWHQLYIVTRLPYRSCPARVSVWRRQYLCDAFLHFWGDLSGHGSIVSLRY